MEVPGKTRIKKGVWNLTRCLVGATVVGGLVGKTVVLGGGMDLLYAERRVCTGVDVANVENRQWVGWKETAVITWLS
jgi:hypothetical protein